MLHITHLTLSGGGMHGVVYIGAFRYLYLENMHKNITHISANSIGTFTGLMFAFKLTIEEMEQVMYSIFSYDKFMNIPRQNYYKLFSDLGLSSTEYATKHLVDMLKTKYKDIEDIEHTTFRDLSKRFGINMYMSTTNITKCQNEIFSIETTPDISVITACQASMSVPLLYKPVKIGDSFYYDGAITNNFPLNIFKDVPKENLLGILLHRDRELPATNNNQSTNLFTLMKNILFILDKFRVQEALHCHIKNNEDYILRLQEFPVSFIKFDFKKEGMFMKITIDQINAMLYLGFDELHKYIQKRLEHHRTKQQRILDTCF